MHDQDLLIRLEKINNRITEPGSVGTYLYETNSLARKRKLRHRTLEYIHRLDLKYINNRLWLAKIPRCIECLICYFLIFDNYCESAISIWTDRWDIITPLYTSVTTC